MLESSNRFDKKMNTSFKTYARNRMVGNMGDYVRQVTRCRRKSNKNVRFISFNAFFSSDYRYVGDRDNNKFIDSIAHTKETPAALIDPDDSFNHLISPFEGDERDILYLYFHEDYSMREIAKRIGKSESRVSQLLSRSIKRLKNLYGNNDKTIHKLTRERAKRGVSSCPPELKENVFPTRTLDWFANLKRSRDFLTKHRRVPESSSLTSLWLRTQRKRRKDNELSADRCKALDELCKHFRIISTKPKCICGNCKLGAQNVPVSV